MSTATAVKERPILFSGPMVKAILQGRKSQTRRIAKISDSWSIPPGRCVDGGFNRYAGHFDERVECPYGKSGDRLWVRESFYIDLLPWSDGGSLADINQSEAHDSLYFKADGTCCEQIPECQCASVGKPRWRSGRYMPRWASRLTLEVTDIRVERLREISAKDIIAEGVVERAHEDSTFGKMPVSAFDQAAYLDLSSLWAAGWDKINGKGSWKSNPWVWVVSFKQIKQR